MAELAGTTDKGPTSGGVSVATGVWSAPDRGRPGVGRDDQYLTAFGWDRAHGSAGGAGAGGPTDEGTESNGILRGPNEAEFAQVQNLGPDNESGAR